MHTDGTIDAGPFATDLLLVEPDGARAELICARLEASPRRYCITRQPSLAPALQYVRVCLPATILLSLELPDIIPSEAVAALAQAAPSVPIVLLADGEHELLATQLMSSTAHEYVVTERATAFELETAVAHAIEWTHVRRTLCESESARQTAKLARSVAHDLNNVLMVISTCGDLALAKLSADDVARRYVQQIRDSAHRAGTLTEKLLSPSGTCLLGGQSGPAGELMT